MTDKLLPIVPGCWCYYKFTGEPCKTVRVLSPGEHVVGRTYVNKGSGEPVWLLDRPVTLAHSLGPQKVPAALERNLIRIDGFKETEQEKARELTT